MRVKEGESDYRYFPEPDIPPMALPPEQVAAWARQIIELPAQKRHRCVAWQGSVGHQLCRCKRRLEQLFGARQSPAGDAPAFVDCPPQQPLVQSRGCYHTRCPAHGASGCAVHRYRTELGLDAETTKTLTDNLYPKSY
jgi:hypothetical protein